MIINKKYKTINDALVGVSNIVWGKPDTITTNNFEKLGFVFQIDSLHHQGEYCIKSQLFSNVLKSVEKLSLVEYEDISYRDENNNLITFAYRVNSGIYCHLHLAEPHLNKNRLESYLNELKFVMVGLSNVINKPIGQILVSIVSINASNLENKKSLINGDFNRNIVSLSKLGSEILDIFRQKNITINIIRHGETEHNRNNILQGQSDSHLIDTSYYNDDVSKVVENSDLVYCSDLGRAKTTASKYTRQFIIDSNLNEMNWGIVDGKLKVSEDFIRYSNTMWKHSKDSYYQGSESLCDLYQRIIIFLYKIYYDVNIGDTVTIFSHNLPLIALRAMAMDKPYDYLEMNLLHEKNYKLI